LEQNAQTSVAVRAWPGALFAITLFVEDLEAAKLFYTTAFGLPVAYADAASAVFNFERTMINLLKIESAAELIAPATVATRAAGSRMVFTLQVDDVDARCAELTARGVHLLNGPLDRPWGIRTASFADPWPYLEIR
jgi:catechol 2,3-dioxygenase-like lactoylglutathione lyase family enzyme